MSSDEIVLIVLFAPIYITMLIAVWALVRWVRDDC